MARQPQLVMEGWDAWRKQLRAAKLTDVAKNANRETGRLVTAQAEKEKASLEGSYPIYRKVKLAASASQSTVQVYEREPFPGIKPIEFGAYVIRVFGRRVPQSKLRRHVYPSWSGNQHMGNAGLVLYPALRKTEPEIEAAYMTAVGRALAEAFPD